MAPISWSAIESALVNWVKAATGLADGRVILANQNGVRPGQSVPTEGAFATVRYDSPQIIGIPAFVENFDAGRPAGQEIERQVQATKRFHASIQIFAPSSTGDQSAMAMASAIQTAASLPSVSALLDVAGIGITDYGTVHNLAAVLGSAWEGRAALDVTFIVVDAPSEFVGYIDTVDVVDTAAGHTLEVSLANGTETIPMPLTLGNAATVSLGPAAGLGATVDTTTLDANGHPVTQVYDGGGQVRFIAGTFAGGPVADVLATIGALSDRSFYTAWIEDGNTVAAGVDLKEQCSILDSSGTTMRVWFDASGPALVPGQPYVFKYGRAF